MLKGRRLLHGTIALIVAALPGLAQTSDGHANSQPASLNDSIHELQQQIRALELAVQDLRTEAAQYRTQAAELQRELAATRSLLSKAAPRDSSAGVASMDRGAGSVPSVSESDARLSKLEEGQQLLSARVDEQYQTKVESASKYRVKLSGIVLFNLFSNRGSVDNEDVPTIALTRRPLDSNGSVGATLRQSELGLEAIGPQLGGAKTSGHVQFDFSGGFPLAPNGVTNGLVRLRTADVRLDWAQTSVVVGQDTLFISPLSPTSFASLSIPALSYAGNLWTWIPQVRVEHRFAPSPESSVLLQGGILDSLTGEFPYAQYQHRPQAGERSRQPAYGMRAAWTHALMGRPLTLGIGGYYGRQNWGLRRNVDGWAGTSDWNLPLTSWLTLTGEFYRGRAIGGLGGGIGRSVLFSGPLTDPATLVHGLNSLGGWGQLKVRPAESKIEFNAAVGQDNPVAKDVLRFVGSQSYLDSSPVRNRSSFINFVYRPRSDLLFSLEYRHLRTFAVNRDNESANQVSTTMGISF